MSSETSPPPRPSLNKVAVPIVGEFLLGMSVALGGLYLASHTSDGAAGSFGLVQQILETLFVVFRVLAIGVGVMVTRLLGSGDLLQAGKTARVTLGACTWAGSAVALWLVFGSTLTLDTLNAPDELWPMATLYMLVLAPSMLLEAYNLCMAAVLRAHLLARESLLIMVAMHGSHLALAFVLMRGVGTWEGWDLNGYAVAWFISRCIGLALHLWTWEKRLGLAPRKADWFQVPGASLWPVLRIGLPGAAAELAYRVAFMVSISATARLGVAALATHSYTLQTLKYVLIISMSIGWACEIMVGRLVGSGDFRAADLMVRKGVRNGLLASGGLALLTAIAAPWLMRGFTRDPAIIHAAQVLLWMSVLLEMGRVFNLVIPGALRASGDIHFPLQSGVVSQLLVLGVGSYLLGRAFGLPGIWAAYVADEWVRAALMWWRWKGKGWLPYARATLRGLRRGDNGGEA